MELGLVEAEGNALDVTCVARIEANVATSHALVVRACHAAALFALGFVFIAQRRITDKACVVFAFGFLRGVNDGDFVLV